MNTSVPTWLRRLLTRGAAVLPAALLQALGGDRASYKFLLIAQVVLALQLPFVLVPLIKATSSRALMGRHRNSAALSAAAWGSLGLVFVANAGLFVSELWPGTDLVPGVTHASECRAAGDTVRRIHARAALACCPPHLGTCTSRTHAHRQAPTAHCTSTWTTWRHWRGRSRGASRLSWRCWWAPRCCWACSCGWSSHPSTSRRPPGRCRQRTTTRAVPAAAMQQRRLALPPTSMAMQRAALAVAAGQHSVTPLATTGLWWRLAARPRHRRRQRCILLLLLQLRLRLAALLCWAGQCRVCASG
jgi:hypothetical protein